MKLFFHSWLSLFVLVASLASCTRNGYPVAATGAASVKIKSDSTLLLLVSHDAAQVISSDLAGLPIIVPEQPPLEGGNVRKPPSSHVCQEGSRQQPCHPVSDSRVSTVLSWTAAAAEHHQPSAAVSNDFAGAVMVFYTLIIAAAVVVFATLVFFLVRWLRRRKPKAN